MANSSYWQNSYRVKRDEVKAYERQIKELRTVLSNLQDNLWDEIRNVNNKLDDLKEDLNKGVRHNSRFAANANSMGNKKEKAASADSSLSVSISEVDNEITRLANRMSIAVTERDQYYQQYQTAKEEERQDRLKLLGSIFS